MKDNRIWPMPTLSRAVMGYVIIIVLVLVIFPIKGENLAIMLANGLVPLAFFAAGEATLDLIEWFISILRSSSRTGT